jgi:hypothetical protein
MKKYITAIMSNIITQKLPMPGCAATAASA